MWVLVLVLGHGIARPLHVGPQAVNQLHQARPIRLRRDCFGQRRAVGGDGLHVMPVKMKAVDVVAGVDQPNEVPAAFLTRSGEMAESIFPLMVKEAG